MTLYTYARLGIGRGAVVLRPGKDGVLEAQFFVEAEDEAKALVAHVNSGLKQQLEAEWAIRSGAPLRVEVKIRQARPIQHRPQ